MRFVTNLLIAAAWCAITGSFGLIDFLVGFMLGAGAIAIVDPTPRVYGARITTAILFAAIYTWDVVKANIAVALDVVSPRRRADPRIVPVTLEHTNDGVGRLLLISLISMTPGTIALQFSDDQRVLLVHAYFGDPDSIARDVHRYERRIQAVRT